jgi:hypothetical protein
VKLSESVRVRTLPPVPSPVLSRWERVKLIIAMNRGPLGLALLVISVALRVFFQFAHHTEVADELKQVAIGLMGGSFALWLAGKTDNDRVHEERAHAELRRRSGQFYPVHPPR